MLGLLNWYSLIFSVFMCFFDAGHFGNVLPTREAIVSVVTEITDITSRSDYEKWEGLGGGERGSY